MMFRTGSRNWIDGDVGSTAGGRLVREKRIISLVVAVAMVSVLFSFPARQAGSVVSAGFNTSRIS